MDLEQPERKELPESVIPMINVVFLLLIFFLISATLAPPVDATPPVSDLKGEAAEPAALVIDSKGAVVFGDLRGEAALSAAAQKHPNQEDAPFALLADADAPGPVLARVLRGLAQRGVQKVALTTLRGSGARACGDEVSAPC